MLLYDNRGRLRMTLQLFGSIYSRIWLFVLLVLIYNIGLCSLKASLERSEVLQAWMLQPGLMPEMKNPTVVVSSSTLIAFSVSFRTNIAWNRFWEACQQTSFMFSKWTDAFTQLMCFINSTTEIKSASADELKLLDYYRGELTHYFTVLSALACARLVRGDIRRMEMRRAMGSSWRDQIMLLELINRDDLTGADELVPMRVLDFDPSSRLRPAERGWLLNSKRRSDSNRSSSKQKGCNLDSAHTRGRKAIKMKTMSTRVLNQLTWYKRGMSLDFRDSWGSSLSVVGELTDMERRRLEMSKDRVQLCLHWVGELVSLLQTKIVTPAPILSRVYQEMSNGALGFAQAQKLSDIPFPFIFAQLLNLMLICFTIYAPLTFLIITGDSWLTPLISTVTVVNFWALNEIAKELENPFGDEPNNVPIVGLHEKFVETLLELAQTELPRDRTFTNYKLTKWGTIFPEGDSETEGAVELEETTVNTDPISRYDEGSAVRRDGAAPRSRDAAACRKPTSPHGDDTGQHPSCNLESNEDEGEGALAGRGHLRTASSMGLPSLALAEEQPWSSARSEPPPRRLPPMSLNSTISLSSGSGSRSPGARTAQVTSFPPGTPAPGPPVVSPLPEAPASFVGFTDVVPASAPIQSDSPYPQPPQRPKAVRAGFAESGLEEEANLLLLLPAAVPEKVSTPDPSESRATASLSGEVVRTPVSDFVAPTSGE